MTNPGQPAARPGSKSRRRRGAQTQTAVAAYLAEHGWPHACDTGAGRAGADILNTPGLAIEVKARRELELTRWLTQAAVAATGDDLPIVIHRPDGMGPAAIDRWPATLRLTDLVRLLHAAGYAPAAQPGNPPVNPSGFPSGNPDSNPGRTP